MKLNKITRGAKMMSLASLIFAPILSSNAKNIISAKVFDSYKQPTHEITPGQSYTLELHVKRTNETKKASTVIFNYSSHPRVNGLEGIESKPIKPRPIYSESSLPDFFDGYEVDSFFNTVRVNEDSVRGTKSKSVSDSNGSPLLIFDGPLNVEGIVGAYSFSVPTNTPLSYITFDPDPHSSLGYIDGTGDWLKTKRWQCAVVREQRTPFLLVDREDNGTSIYVTGLGSPDGSRPRTPVRLQRSLDLKNWETLVPGKDGVTLTYTNAATGSFEVLDNASASLPTAFYRAVAE